MLCLIKKSFMNSLEPSSWAAPIEGPKQFRPKDLNLSVIPKTSGSSGPTIVISILFSIANSASSSTLFEGMGMFVTFGSCSVPPFPGATNI